MPRPARRTQSLFPNVLRQLFAPAQRPNMISFAAGHPPAEATDTGGIEAATAEALAKPTSLRYGPTAGIPSLRHELAIRSLPDGLVDAAALAERIVVTSGSQQGIDLAARAFLDEGDVVAVEDAAYPAALQVFSLAGARMVSIACDADGLIPDALEAALIDGARTGAPIRLLYTTPTFSNPTGRVVPAARRRAVLALAERHDLLLLEDDPYRDIAFTEPPATLLETALREGTGAAHVVLLRSVSKIIAPGLRVGWAVLPDWAVGAFSAVKQASDLQSNSLAQEVCAAYLAAGRLEAHLPLIRDLYRRKADAMQQALTAHLGNRLAVEPAKGGMFLWGRLAEGLSVRRTLEAGIEGGVMFAPGYGFMLDQSDDSALRLCFANAAIDRMPEGMRRLAGALRG